MIHLLTNNQGSKISKYIYGQFSEHLGTGIYGGIYVGKDSAIENVNGMRSDVVNALKDIHIPVLRWPGGLFADTYHWRQGIGPQDQRQLIVNTNWGDVVENNHFGTHEYFELLRQLGSDAYINANVGSGTVQEMAEWVEYITRSGKSPMSDLRQKNGQKEPWPLKFFGIGNESWGGGGHMRPEYYADVYRQYECFLPQNDKDHPIYRSACGPNVDDYDWTDKVMKYAHEYMDGISLHYYTLPTGDWHHKGSSMNFPEDQWQSVIDKAKYMDELLTRHSTIMDKYDPEKKVNLNVDEWGTWYDSEPGTHPGFLQQQNTIRDAMVAAINFNIFHKHADRVKLTCIAQTVNVLQAMLLTKDSQMVKTPTYYVFDLYKNHMDANVVPGIGTISEDLTYTASTKNDQLTISVANTSVHESQEVSFKPDTTYAKVVSSKAVVGTKMDEHNSFDNPDEVQELAFKDVSVDPSGVIKYQLPPMSVVTTIFK